MRAFPFIVPIVLVASPALAQTKPAAATAPAVSPPATTAVPPQLTDPATADMLGRMMQAMSKAFMNLPVGELEAAAQGRQATRVDRRRTVRDVGRSDDPNFERDFERNVASSGAMIQSSMKALAAAWPGMMKGLSDASRELEKATANMPAPNYPKR